MQMFVENTGQIKLAHAFGECISRYAADEGFTRYLEIGTWNGCGSTCCFYDGFSKRNDSPVLQSYEIFKQRADDARAIWAPVSSIQIIHGRMLKDHECPIYDDVKRIHSSINPEWHAEDIRNFWSCSYVEPNEPQVVLLDGAEYLTYFEFEKFKHMESIQVFMLDDTMSAKNPHAYKVLSESPEWRVVASGTDRNGWAVFEKITASSAQRPESPVHLE